MQGGLGGAFFGRGNVLDEMPDATADMMRMRGLGLQNAPQIAAGLQAGAPINQDPAQTRRESIAETREMFEDAVSAGLDRARTGRALQVMAEQASRGLGAGSAATEQFKQALGMAQTIFGKGGIEGAEMDFTQRAVGGLQEGTRAGGGLGQIAGIQAVREVTGGLEGADLSKLGPYGELMVQGSINDAQGMEKLMVKMGMSPEQIEKAGGGQEVIARLQNERVAQLGQLATQITGGTPYGKEYIVGQFTGAKTLTEFLAGGEMVAEAEVPPSLRQQPARDTAAPGGLDVAGIVAGAFGGEGAGPMAPVPVDRPEQRFEVTTEPITEAAGKFGQIAQDLAKIDAEKITTGFNTAGEQAGIFATAVEEATKRIHKVLEIQGIEVAPGTPGAGKKAAKAQPK